MFEDILSELSPEMLEYMFPGQAEAPAPKLLYRKSTVPSPYCAAEPEADFAPDEGIFEDSDFCCCEMAPEEASDEVALDRDYVIWEH